MKHLRAIVAGITCSMVLNPAMAAENCISQTEAMAMKTAAVQQQLMVAAFMCNGATAYNHFVRTYQPELRSSDAALKAYFVRSTGSETAYDSFKSKVANMSALSQGENSRAFCAQTDLLFAAALQSRASLTAFVEEAPSPPGFRSACIANSVEASTGKRVRVSEAAAP